MKFSLEILLSRPHFFFAESDSYRGVEVVDIDKHGKIMQQLFGNSTGYDPYQLGRYRRSFFA